MRLTLEDGTKAEIKHLSKQDLAAFSDILRNETVAWYHTTRGDLSTEAAPMDEEDRS